MRLPKEVLVTIVFLAIYIPLGFAIWLVTGQTTNLVIGMIAGLSVITAYVYYNLARYRFRRFFRRFRRPSCTYIELDDEPEEEIEDEPDNLEGFRALFSQDKHGGEAT